MRGAVRLGHATSLMQVGDIGLVTRGNIIFTITGKPYDKWQLFNLKRS